MADGSTRWLTRWLGRLVWGAVAAVVVIWIIAFARAAALHPTPRTLTDAIAVFGVGLTIICGALWIGDVTGTVHLRPGAARAIWVTLIVTVLSTSVAVFKGFFLERRSLPRVQVDKVVLLREDLLGQLQPRGNSLYTGSLAPILFAALFSNLAPNASGQYQAEITVSLENETAGLAELTRVQRTYATLEDWQQPDKRMAVEAIKKSSRTGRAR